MGRGRIPPSRAAFLIFAAAAAFRILFLVGITRTACLDINLDPISDMETFHRWALTIADGDWLGRSDFHPFHPWQSAVAPREVWDRWYGHVYHQEPLYPYFIASIYTVLPRSPFSIIAIQMLLGAAGCAFVYRAARLVAPEGAAIAAGLLSAAYGPYLFYESLLLRDSLLIPMHALLLWAVLAAWREQQRRKARMRWIGAGALTGLIYLTKAAIFPFFLLVIWLGVRRRRGQPAGRRLEPAAALLAGFLIAVSPVVARNLAVGAPPLKITTRGPIEFINGNNRWHIGIGWFDGDDARVSAYARQVLLEADGRLLPTIGAVLEDWSDDPVGFARLQLRKLGFFFAPFEMPNNASYSYFRLRSPLLRHAAPRFLWITPLALVGLYLSLRNWRRILPVHLFLATGIGFTIAFYVIARFRAPLMPAILILAGLGLATMIEQAARRRHGRAAAMAALAAAALVVSLLHDLPDENLLRPQDFLVAMQGYEQRGRPEDALREAEHGRRIFPKLAHFHRAAGMLYEDLGRTAEALAALRRALALDPSDPEVARAISRLQRRRAP